MLLGQVRPELEAHQDMGAALAHLVQPERCQLRAELELELGLDQQQEVQSEQCEWRAGLEPELGPEH